MSDLLVRPYYSRAFGDQFAVIPRHLMDELGLLERTRIYAHLDDLRPARVVRFDTQDEAERYVKRLEEAGQAPRPATAPSRPSSPAPRRGRSAPERG